MNVERATVELLPLPPYDFDLALAYLRTSPSAILERIDADGVYRRAVTLDGRDLLLTLRSVGSVAAPRLLLEVAGDRLDPAGVASAAALVTRIFSLRDDPAPFVALAARDPVLARLAGRYHGLRPVLIASPYEGLLWAIIGQQINVAFARTLKRALVDLAGRRLALDGQEYPLSPTPDAVAGLDERALRERQFSRQKAAYLRDLSRAVADGELDLAALGARPYEDAVAALTRHKGIGRWTAEYVLMRGLGAPDSLPAADLGLRAIIGRAYGLARTATEAEVRQIAAAWAGRRGWAAFHWWLALQEQTIDDRR
ncbi:MAG TPA: hypothetical protein VFW96_09525 [Thermomicrobiales bacterium]|nr:hypothetical protein [Thermomicrobiales bacterium]